MTMGHGMYDPYPVTKPAEMDSCECNIFRSSADIAKLKDYQRRCNSLKKIIWPRSQDQNGCHTHG